MPAASQVAAILGERANTQIFFAIVQAVMVDVVHDEMVRSVHYLAVHFDTLAAGFSHGVEIPVRTLGEPCIFAQPQVVFGINDGELTPSQRYNTRLFI